MIKIISQEAGTVTELPMPVLRVGLLSLYSDIFNGRVDSMHPSQPENSIAITISTTNVSPCKVIGIRSGPSNIQISKTYGWTYYNAAFSELRAFRNRCSRIPHRTTKNENKCRRPPYTFELDEIDEMETEYDTVWLELTPKGNIEITLGYLEHTAVLGWLRPDLTFHVNKAFHPDVLHRTITNYGSNLIL